MKTPSPAQDAAVTMLLVGVVAKAHGIRGEVAVWAYNPDSSMWRVGTTLYLVNECDVVDDVDEITAIPERVLKVRGCRFQSVGGTERVLCTLEGVADRTSAEALRGGTLAVALEEVPPAEADAFYHHELRGFAVVDPAGVVLGTVVGVFSAPAQDLIEVASPSVAGKPAETWFFPFVSVLVPVIDREARVLTLDAPEGLIP